MATFLNRVPTGRLICLHSLLKYLVDRFQKSNFTLREAQFDAETAKSIHDHCPLLVKVRAARSPVCQEIDTIDTPQIVSIMKYVIVMGIVTITDAMHACMDG